MQKPRSVIHKWLHFDKSYSVKQVRTVLGFEPSQYMSAMERPWEHFTVLHMEKIAYLLDKSVGEIFWACYKRPYSYIFEDDAKLRTVSALERAGIR